MLAALHSYVSEVVFILQNTLIFVNVATWLRVQPVITHTNYSACVLMLDKRERNFFFLDFGYKKKTQEELEDLCA